MLRLLDFVLAFFGLLFLWPVLLLITIIGYFDTGSPLFFQTRVGRHQKPFTLIKFRTMAVDTASMATHLLKKDNATKLGRFLRKTKLDELPQLINVLKGEMSLVGPRPSLFNQKDLITARNEKNIYNARPGITGLAQINQVDMSTPERLAELDAQMLKTLDIKHYVKYIFATVTGRGSGDRLQD
ncbi:sugar transferase [Vibrio casei]|uniref:Sugar transferase n=1 Tax=Vibrio casei TaxID=673372 RepID=A0A368LH81_9VIBR|nr:sugar transferase [Vibrio casei]RCS69130.1 sugar transferase [Vibrio casei]SJN37329.1 Lipid carrier : UDP-N-acetylgalactosaminyltransferase [Vibrio casei]